MDGIYSSRVNPAVRRRGPTTTCLFQTLNDDFELLADYTNLLLRLSVLDQTHQQGSRPAIVCLNLQGRRTPQSQIEYRAETNTAGWIWRLELAALISLPSARQWFVV